MSQDDRLATLEVALTALAEQAAQTAAVAVAQGVILRALAEGLARGSSTSVGDVHELAIAMSDHMPDAIAASVRAILAEASAPSGARH